MAATRPLFTARCARHTELTTWECLYGEDCPKRRLHLGRLMGPPTYLLPPPSQACLDAWRRPKHFYRTSRKTEYDLSEYDYKTEYD